MYKGPTDLEGPTWICCAADVETDSFSVDVNQQESEPEMKRWGKDISHTVIYYDQLFISFADALNDPVMLSLEVGLPTYAKESFEKHNQFPPLLLNMDSCYL